MGLLDDFFGGSARKDLRKGREAFRTELMAGRDAAMADFGEAERYFDPYIESGTRSNAAWADLMGLNGEEARAAAQGRYTSDPLFTAMGDRALRGISRGVAATGQTGQGTQAGTNALVSNYNSYLDKLVAGANTGLTAAAGASGVKTHAGDTEFATGQQLAGGEQSFSNAMAQSRSIGINNLLGVAGIATRLFTGASLPKGK